MTPEFRHVLYLWRKPAWTESTAPEDAKKRDEWERTSIPLQLQMLFATMQAGRRGAASTTALTKSFGWDRAEAFQQHDIQELSRVLFDALEVEMAATAHSHVMPNLFRGVQRDYVRCTQCGFTRERKDLVLDLALVVKAEGKAHFMGTLEEALGNFVQQELLAVRATPHFSHPCRVPL
jgi:ubiquitin carboxyl-terminal hydrolase 47